MAITPVATAGFAKYLYERDTKWAKGDESKAKFKMWLVLDPSVPDQDAFIKERVAAHKAAGGTSKNCPVKPGNSDWKQDPEMFYAQFKTGRDPVVVDTKNQDITHTNIKVFGGDKVRIMFKVIDDSPIEGAFLRLQKVQLVEKSSGEGGDFDEIDGFTANEQQMAAKARRSAEEEEDDEDDF